MNRISAVIITKDEEHNIVACLHSIEKVADEIIVVDSFSKDNTVKICEEQGCVVYKRKFSGYKDQRKFGVEQTQYDWILSIDADERLNDELINSLRKFKTQVTDNKYYYIYFRTYYLGKFLRFSGLQKEKHCRLYHKKHISYSDREIHETLLVKDKKGSIIEKGKILHYTYRNLSEQIYKMNDYTTKIAEEKWKQGKKSPCLITIYLKSVFWFCKAYFLNLGILDGYQGFVWAYFGLFYTFLKYSKLKELHKNTS